MNKIPLSLKQGLETTQWAEHLPCNHLGLDPTQKAGCSRAHIVIPAHPIKKREEETGKITRCLRGQVHAAVYKRPRLNTQVRTDKGAQVHTCIQRQTDRRQTNMVVHTYIYKQDCLKIKSRKDLET